MSVRGAFGILVEGVIGGGIDGWRVRSVNLGLLFYVVTEAKLSAVTGRGSFLAKVVRAERSLV